LAISIFLNLRGLKAINNCYKKAQNAQSCIVRFVPFVN
jgi:hypothetical protein